MLRAILSVEISAITSQCSALLRQLCDAVNGVARSKCVAEGY